MFWVADEEIENLTTNSLLKVIMFFVHELITVLGVDSVYCRSRVFYSTKIWWKKIAWAKWFKGASTVTNIAESDETQSLRHANTSELLEPLESIGCRRENDVEGSEVFILKEERTLDCILFFNLLVNWRNFAYDKLALTDWLQVMLGVVLLSFIVIHKCKLKVEGEWSVSA